MWSHEGFRAKRIPKHGDIFQQIATCSPPSPSSPTITPDNNDAIDGPSDEEGTDGPQSCSWSGASGD